RRTSLLGPEALGLGREKRAIVAVRRCSFGFLLVWAGLMRPACAARFVLGPVKLRGSAREQEQSVAHARQLPGGLLPGHGGRERRRHALWACFGERPAGRLVC